MSGIRTQNLFFHTARINEVPLPPLPDLRSEKFQRLFKFLHSRHLERLIVDETIQINSSKVFREKYFQMEVKNHRINDPEEGYHLHGQGEFDAGDELQSYNTVGTILDPFHMLSFSMGTFEEGCRAFCLPDAGLDEPYDACVEIMDVPAFSALIQPSSLIQNPDTETFELPLGAAFANIHWGEATYTEIYAELLGDIRTFRPPPPSPYRKDSSLSAQKEFRFVFIPGRQTLKSQPFIVKLPGLSQLLKVRGTAEIKRALGR